MDMNTTSKPDSTDRTSDDSISALDIALVILNVSTSPFIIVTNSVVLVAIWKTSSLHTPGNMLMCNLAVSDLAVGLLIQPLFILSTLKRLVVNDDILSSVSKTKDIAGLCLCGVSFLTVTAISLDRMIALKFHLRYNSLVTMNKTALAIAVMWTVSGFSSSAKLLKAHALYPFFGLIIVSCLVANFFAYFEVYRVVIRHRGQIHSQMQVMSANAGQGMRFKQLRRSAVTIFYVYCLFLLCYLPYIATLVADVFVRTSFGKYYAVPSTIVFLNSALNPVMYFWRKSNIRQAVKRILKFRTPWARWNATKHLFLTRVVYHVLCYMLCSRLFNHLTIISISLPIAFSVTTFKVT